MNPRELRQHLREPGLRQRIGIWLTPLECMGKEREDADRLSIEHLDLRQAYLNSLPKGTRYAGLSRPDGPQHLLKVLDEVGHRTHSTDCILAYHIDLLLSGLTYEGRDIFWKELYSGLPYLLTAIILSLPEKADTLFQPSHLERWESDSRLARGSL